MDKIIIYTNETCGYCKQIKEELEKTDLNFENKLTSEHAVEWQDVVNLTGIPSVPTITYDNEYFVPGRDFQNANQIVDKLKSLKTPRYTQTQKTFERVKTLNYNMNLAFGKLDQLLRQIETKINTDEHKSTS